MSALVGDLAADIDRGGLSGVVVLAGTGGHVFMDRAMGTLVPGGAPMPRDAIFRITSLTKPIVAVGLLRLVDEGRVALDDLVAHHLREFAESKAPAAPAITVRDLLRHTAGFPDLQDPEVDRLMNDARTAAELSRGLASLPALEPPGKVFRYGPSFEVVGRLIEVLAGQPLDRYLDEHVIRPLGMRDTSFVVPERDRSRLPAIVRLDEGRMVTVTPAGTEPAVDTALLSGGGGLRSTAPDLYRFCRMLLGEGQLDGVRVLSDPMARLLVTDQLGALSPWRDDGTSWGLGVEVAGPPGAMARAYGWGGFFGGTFWVSRESSLIVVVLAHQEPTGRPSLEGRVRSLVGGGM